jgi:hypothetical protein
MIAKSPSKPRIYVQPEIIGAGKFVRGRRAPEARSCEREGNLSQRLEIARLAEGKRRSVARFSSRRFSRQKSAHLARKRAPSRWPYAEERRQQDIPKASSDKDYGADSLWPPMRSSTPFRGAERGRGNGMKGREVAQKRS